MLKINKIYLLFFTLILTANSVIFSNKLSDKTSDILNSAKISLNKEEISKKYENFKKVYFEKAEAIFGKDTVTTRVITNSLPKMAVIIATIKTKIALFESLNIGVNAENKWTEGSIIRKLGNYTLTSKAQDQYDLTRFGEFFENIDEGKFSTLLDFAIGVYGVAWLTK